MDSQDCPVDEVIDLADAVWSPVTPGSVDLEIIVPYGPEDEEECDLLAVAVFEGMTSVSQSVVEIIDELARKISEPFVDFTLLWSVRTEVIRELRSRLSYLQNHVEHRNPWHRLSCVRMEVMSGNYKKGL